MDDFSWVVDKVVQSDGQETESSGDNGSDSGSSGRSYGDGDFNFQFRVGKTTFVA